MEITSNDLTHNVIYIHILPLTDKILQQCILDIYCSGPLLLEKLKSNPETIQ